VRLGRCSEEVREPSSMTPRSYACIFCIVLIHFYRASHRMSLSKALPTIAIHTVSEFTRRSVHM